MKKRMKVKKAGLQKAVEMFKYLLVEFV